jgi:hypothetical protein
MDSGKPYVFSHDYAMRNGELDLWREDTRLNGECIRAVDEAIRACNHEQYRYEFSGAVSSVVEAFGFGRLTHTLAGAVATSFNDGRFSSENKRWAQGFGISSDRHGEFNFDTHRAVLDGFIDSARKAHVEMLAQEVGQYEKSRRMADRNRLTWFHSDFGVHLPNPGVTEERLMERHAEIMDKKAERQSVLAQIRAARGEAKRPRKPKPERGKNSHGEEL